MTTPLVGRPSSTFIDPTGVEWPLSDITDERGFFTTDQVAGWGAGTFEFSTDPFPRGGESVRHIRTMPARITWPLYVWGETYEDFTDRYRAIRRAFISTNHRNSPGILRIARPDATSREIDVFYEAGFEGQSGENWLYAKPVLTLFAPDGLWRDTTPTTITRVHSTSSQSFLDPFLTLSSGQVLGDTTVNNPGDTDAWPEWTITGPMVSLTASNVTLGREFVLTHTLASSSESITITTLRPTVRGPLGENLVNTLDWPGAYLWGLAPGDNTIEFTVGGANVGTSIELRFHARYDGV